MSSIKGKRLNPFEHALKRPDTYIGSANTSTDERWILEPESKVAIFKRMKFNKGLFNIVREIGSNAIDNCWRSDEKGVPLKKIEIKIDTEEQSIEIWNDGYCIPIQKELYDYTDPRSGETITEELYPAELFFGNMFAGTNYNDTEVRKTSGRNGMGAKATIVFSTEATIEHTSPDDKKKFVQVYAKNGTNRTDPKITSFRNKTGYTSFKFVPDYEYFQYPSKKKPRMDKNLISVIRLYAQEVAMITGVLVKFSVDDNSELIRISSLEKYIRLFYPDRKNKTVLLKTPNGDECVFVEKGDEPEFTAQNAIDQVSFVNGIRTSKGGIHVIVWQNTVIAAFVRAFNAKRRVGNKKDIKTSAKEVYPYIHMFVRIETDRPNFDTQTKDNLVGIYNSDDKKKTVKYKLFNARKKAEKDGWVSELKGAVTRMLKMNFISQLEDKLVAKSNMAVMKKAKTVTHGRVTGVDGLHDANNAGQKGYAQDCTLYITEGKSAGGFATAGIKTVPNGQDYYGCFPIRGKFVNASRNTLKKVMNNKEVKAIIKILNLQLKVDYEKDENFNTLRYGTVSIMADTDDDGFHIRGLVINFFYELFPSLLKRDPPFLESFSTAVVVAETKGKSVRNKKFYSYPEFKKWSMNNSLQKYNIKYLKGLGSIENIDATGYFADPKVVEYFLEGDENEYMSLGFGDKADERKTWITRDMKKPKELEDTEGTEDSDLISLSESTEVTFEDSSENSDLDTEEESVSEPPKDTDLIELVDLVYDGRLGLSTFVDQQLVIYHKMAITRALPNVLDGLKEVQRKILYGILQQKLKTPRKLTNVAAIAMERSSYHHGEVAFQDTIKKMAMGFVGKNNIPLLQNVGNFGSLTEGGIDAAASRYLSVKEENIVRTIYKVADEPLLIQLKDEHKISIEYKNYMPCIPMILINGSSGIASGWSTDIPKHNPENIIDWLEKWLDNEINDIEPLLPWYRNYNGTISFRKDQKDNIIGWQSEGILEKDISKSGKYKGWWHIKALTVGSNISVSTLDACKKKIEYLMEPTAKGAKKAIITYEESHPSNGVHFVIKPSNDFIPDIKTRGKNNFNCLHANCSYNNMVAINEDGYPIRFKTPEDILKYYCPRRLDLYRKRKAYLLGQYRKEMKIASNRYRFVKGVKDKKLDLYKKDDELEKILSKKPWRFDKILTGKSNEPSFEYLLSLQMRSMTVKKLEELKKIKDSMQEKIDDLKDTSVRDLWREDLVGVRKAYKKMLKTRVEAPPARKNTKTTRRKK